MLRISVGFMVAPMVAVIVFTVGIAVLNGTLEKIGISEFVIGAFLLVGPWAYAIGLILGLPLFLLLRKVNFVKAWIFFITGGIAGLLAGLYLLNGSAHDSKTILCSLGGGLSAATFWYIACRNHSKSLESDA
jgi:hypothetical protein